MNTPDPTPEPRPITDEERAKRAERARKAREARAAKALKAPQTVVSSGKRVDAPVAQAAPTPAPAGKVHIAHGRKLKIVVPRRRVVPVRSGGFTMRG